MQSWAVEPDAYTRHVSADWDGQCSNYMASLPSIAWSEVPKTFGLAVVFGPSGSGKSTLAQKLVAHASCVGAGKAAEVMFQKDMAVVSHPGFNGEALNTLSAVGLNKIPSWCRPYHVLSNGEQSRVRTALSLQHGALLDDFAQVVDEANANSMAASLVKLARSKQYKNIVVSTTKSCVLPFLEPDFIILTKSGKLVLNPYAEELRRPKLVWDYKISGFTSFTEGGWQSSADDIDDGIAVDAIAGEDLPNVLWDKTLQVSVEMDEAVGEASHAFDYEFDGISSTNIKCVDFGLLQESVPGFKLAAVLGPSGTGKSQCLKHVDAEVKDNFEWDRARSVFSQLTNRDPSISAQLCVAVALPVETALRPFHVLSDGEQHRSTMARQLDSSLDTCRSTAVGLDEFTSVLDRSLAKTICLAINDFVKSHPSCRPIIVATVHKDIARYLHAEWVLDTERGRMLKQPPPKPVLGRLLSFRLSQTEGDEDEVKQLLKPPVLDLTVRKLGDSKRSADVFNESFEQHHYMKGRLPYLFAGVVVRSSQTNALVAFHAVSNQFGTGMGKISTRESRLVVPPEFQGFGIGPKLSDAIGQLLIDSGKCFYSVTHHPRLGGYRERSRFWTPTLLNGKEAKTTLAGAACKPRVSFRHFFIGTSEDGNRKLAAESCEESPGLMKRPGKFIMPPTANPSRKVLEQIKPLHGKTPSEYFADVERTDKGKKRKWVDNLLRIGTHLELRELDNDELLDVQQRFKRRLVDAGISVDDGHGTHVHEASDLTSNTEPLGAEELAITDDDITALFSGDPQEEAGAKMEVETPVRKPRTSTGSLRGSDEKNLRVPRSGSLPGHAVILRTSKEAKSAYIAARVEQANGMTIAEACDGSVTFTKPSGKHFVYKLGDIKYDVAQGLLTVSSNRDSSGDEAI